MLGFLKAGYNLIRIQAAPRRYVQPRPRRVTQPVYAKISSIFLCLFAIRLLQKFNMFRETFCKPVKFQTADGML